MHPVQILVGYKRAVEGHDILAATLLAGALMPVSGGITNEALLQIGAMLTKALNQEMMREIESMEIEVSRAARDSGVELPVALGCLKRMRAIASEYQVHLTPELQALVSKDTPPNAQNNPPPTNPRAQPGTGSRPD